jgi:Beta-lactamase
MGVRIVPWFILVALASLAIAADGPMPWAFVNGSVKGYSIKLDSASPAGSRIWSYMSRTPKTIFQSGSVGKQFTATAVMLLVEEGKIGLDDHLNKGSRRRPTRLRMAACIFRFWISRNGMRLFIPTGC